MNTSSPYLVLGIDVGIGSAGWSLLNIANSEIVNLGVHLWKVPQEPKTKVSTAAVRREELSARRVNARRARRMMVKKGARKGREAAVPVQGLWAHVHARRPRPRYEQAASFHMDGLR